MELDATDPLVLAVVIVNETAGVHLSRIGLTSLSGFFVTQHIKVILEDIDDFVGLQGFLNIRGDPIDELIKLGISLSLSLLLFLDLLFLLLG